MVAVLILPYEFTCACGTECRIDYKHEPQGSGVSVQHPCGKSQAIVLQGKAVAFYEKKGGAWV